MKKTCLMPQQITQGNKIHDILAQTEQNDFLKNWFDLYFEIEVTTLPSSRKVQQRDLTLFIKFMIELEGTDLRSRWSPRLSAEFKRYLSYVIDEDGKRRWNDRTANRILAHVKTFAKWLHKIRPFLLGDPMEKIKGFSLGNALDIDRAVKPSERRRLLDAADQLPVTGGRSRDRSRFKGVATHERPVRKNFRPWRNRAIIYALVETGMRREAVTRIDAHNVDFTTNTITVLEKGRVMQTYPISREGATAIKDYMEKERPGDAGAWASPALFLKAGPVSGSKGGDGRLTPWTVNKVWNDVWSGAGIEAKRTPHCARHAMGKHVMEKTQNLAAVQRQLGHKNAVYSLQYSRISKDELQTVLDDR